MQRSVLLSILLVILLGTGPGSLIAAAQGSDDGGDEITCEIDIQSVMSQVQQVCTGIGRDEVCYGNVEVNAIPRQSQVDLNFNNPGDSADVSLIRSLYLSALDLASEQWGIAQMRLLANLSQQQPQEVTLLLFGDVTVEDRAESRPEIELTVNPVNPARIRNVPTLNSLIIDVAQPGETVMAIGRLEDNSWIRVKEDELGRVGWIASQLLSLDGIDLDALAVDDADTPYFGSMQALYFQSGSSPGCGSTVTDGLLVQTPEGVARLTLLINEVNIELLGAESGATALIEANPDAGMNINMLNGQANISSQGATVFVDTNTSVNIPLDENLSPDGSISEPVLTSVEVAQGVILLPLIDNIVNTLFPNTGGATGDGGGNRNGRSDDQGNRNGNANGGGNRNGSRNGK